MVIRPQLRPEFLRVDESVMFVFSRQTDRYLLSRVATSLSFQVLIG